MAARRIRPLHGPEFAKISPDAFPRIGINLMISGSLSEFWLCVLCALCGSLKFI